MLSNLVPERGKAARSPFTKASTHEKKLTTTMSGASQATQNTSPLPPQSAREFYRPSSGLFSVGFVFTSYYKRYHIYIYFICTQTLFGTALTLADGMLTPAVSVTSAVAGIALSAPNLTNNISSISIGFLVALFLAQRFGTAKLSFIFSPGKTPGPVAESVLIFLASIVAFIWLALLGATGIYNIASYPAIFRAFDPSRAILCQSPVFHFILLAEHVFRVRPNKTIRCTGWCPPRGDWLRGALR